jgi:malonyl-CoA/methylmalonyl-CoA synthetase
MNLAKLLADKAASLDDKTAIDFEGDRISFEALFDGVRRGAAFLESQGIRPGDRVAFQLPKSLEFITLHLAGLSLGAVSLPLNDRYTPDEIKYFLEDSGASLFISDGEGCRRSDSILRAFGEEKIIAMNGDSTRVDGKPLEGVVDAADQDTAMICYTSGTTGRPKGAMITHGNLIRNMNALHEAWQWRSHDVLLHALPLYHIHGLIVALHGALNAGSTVVMLPRFDAARVSERLGRAGCTLFMGVPTMYRRLADLWEASGGPPELSRLRAFICGSAPLAPLLYQRFQEMTGHTILERYGMTETGIISSNPLATGERMAGSVGFPLQGVSIRIKKAGNRPDGSDDVGEVQVKGTNVFKGYWNAPDKTAASFDSDWFKTGDLGRLDPDDRYRLYLQGRIKELIISGGLNVYPRELEELLESRGDIKEAAVLGLDDAEWGERVVAAVVPLDPGALDGNEVRDFLEQHLAPFKIPKEILLLESLPRNSMGKVLKSDLKKRLERI